ncbi:MULTISPECIES: alpha/beta hydrolase family protein [Acidobacteriaceae]|uniref:alpha/beta hydrolase family protein n=1 Tax=Acidobacteriaceae TaxID=204434 RepID=UPI00131AA3D8|nr:MULTISPECIES: alpha/beta hydrolase family protein [Acidobacteriaceae]MDW5265718.1 alpha/beta hydrolase family protein [Edaphobacter sp.]
MRQSLYAKWMYDWEYALTTRDTNRIVRPLEWGFDWLADFSPLAAAAASDGAALGDLDRMIAVNQDIVERSDDFFGYETPTDFRLEARHPQLFPTNVRPETLAQDAELKRQAAAGELESAEFLRFTSAVRTRYPENDVVNARWYPADAEKQVGKPKQAIIVMPQWNADAFSHNALCTLFNRFGISALRLSKPFHDIRRPAELERSDYAVSSNIGRTTEACRQAVVDIRSCLDWLESQGYEQFGVLGTSLGSCYAFIAAAHDARLKVCAFNHASTWFGDVVWTGQSTRHVREAFEQAGLTQDTVRQIFTGISPMSYMERFAAHPKRVLVVHATYDLTFLREFSLDVLANFDRFGIDYVSKVLPCGHYTTGETPYKYIDGWYLGSFVYGAFKRLREQGRKA